jgi:hypothetical protein
MFYEIVQMNELCKRRTFADITKSQLMNISELAMTGRPSLAEVSITGVLPVDLIVALPRPLLILLISLYVPVIILSALGSLLIIFGVARWGQLQFRKKHTQ